MRLCPKCGAEFGGLYCPKCHKTAYKLWSNKDRVFELMSGGVTSWVGYEVLRLGSPVVGALLASAGLYTLVQGMRRKKR